MKKIIFSLAAALLMFSAIQASEVNHVIKALPGEVTKKAFGKFERYNFTFDGTGAVVVVPKKAAPGNPWIWRARFFGHQPQTDLALLEKGWFMVYVNVGGLFGAPKAVERWNKFYTFLTEKCNLSRRPVLEGMSRGGLIIFNWAKKNPDKTAAVYADAPVCDFNSWPGGKGRGKGAKSAYKQCLNAYGLDEKSALTYNDQPFHQLEAMAKADVPVLAVCGVTDDVVPMEENIDIFVKNYRKLNGHIRVIPKPGCWHHPHSLQDPAMIVDFLELYALGQNQFVKPRGLKKALANLKNSSGKTLQVNLVNCAKKFPRTFAKLGKLFPGCQIKVSSGDKTPGNLYIIECSGELANAVKLEAVLKNIRKNAPQAAIVIYDPADKALVAHYTADEPIINKSMVTAKRKKFNNCRKPIPCHAPTAALEKVAEKYSCASVNAAKDAAERIRHLEFAGAVLYKYADKVADENIAATLNL